MALCLPVQQPLHGIPLTTIDSCFAPPLIRQLLAPFLFSLGLFLLSAAAIYVLVHTGLTIPAIEFFPSVLQCCYCRHWIARY